jgi:hypothetical protein
VYASQQSIPTFRLPLVTKSLARVGRELSARRGRSAALAFLLAALTISCDRTNRPGVAGLEPKRFQTVAINNVEPRRDVTGAIIDAHDGCLQFFAGRYYLYGTAYGRNASYDSISNHYRVYSSPDLGRWTYEGELLRGQPEGYYYRPYVVFNPNTRKYVLWYNWYLKLWNGQAGVATSDTPVGPFKIVNPKVPLSRADSRPGDGSLFVDDDGTGYFIYTAIGEGYAVRVERLTRDYLGSSGETSSVLAVGCEAPLLFRRDNLYYALCGPVCAACPEGSEAQVYTSASPLGPFTTKPWLNINRRLILPDDFDRLLPFTRRPRLNINGRYVDDMPIVSAQETWVARIPTSTGPAFIWMGDRWGSCPDGVKGHDFQFWTPLEFSPEGDIVPIKDIARWYITWAGGK